MIVLLSRQPELYSTRWLRVSGEKLGYKVVVLNVLDLEVKVGQGVYFHGEQVEPTCVIPRLSPNLLLSGGAVLREWRREGVKILNQPESLEIANNQLTTLQRLAEHGLPIPPTSFCSQPSSRDTFDSILDEFPKVVKLLHGSQGKGVNLVKERGTAQALLTTLETLQSSGITQKFYTEASGVDQRLVVLKGRVVGAIERTAQSGDFRANLHQGAEVKVYTPTDEEQRLAIAAVQAVGLDFAGVDLIKTDQGSMILEVNGSPGLEGVEAGHFGSIAEQVIQAVNA